MRAAAVLVLASILSLVAPGCGDNLPGSIALTADERFAGAFGDFVAFGNYRGLVMRDAVAGDAASVIVAHDASLPVEGYRVEREGTVYRVLASDVLGAQYGAAAALEALGFRFRHPFDTYVPPRVVPGDIDRETHAPEIRVRGFQLHTLHPIEGYFAFWEPSPGSTNDAKRIIDWVIKNRGNFLQWVALDDIITDPERHAAWKPFTAELIDYAHSRGVKVGLNIQLFGQANLQQAFDLVDVPEETTPIPEQIAARLPLITDGVTFDTYVLSFGEFFNANPEKFIESVNEVQAQLAVRAPAAEMQGFIHVGAEQRIEYMGESLIYYFLVKYAHPAVVPAVHTVMFYNLYEPAHGAYHHEDFAEHRALLEDRICANQSNAYIPETAYWVAFDVSVPQFFPLYVRNRWLDLAELAKLKDRGCGYLDNHTVFQTAWEWGYWLNDVTVLRASYELPATYTELLEHALAPELGAAVPVIEAVIELQREYLMSKELVQYLAGRDASIDAGRLLGIVSQPDRVTFDDLAKGADRAAFRTNVLDELTAYVAALEPLAEDLRAAKLPSSRWGNELEDGMAVNVLRARFAIALYAATLAHLDGDAAAATAHRAEAEAHLEAARAIVKSRHADLHDTHGRRLVDRTENRTFYQYGYLYMADTLCFWRRELVEVGNLMGDSEPIPDCLYK